ncbi:hypothetical protein QR680_019166 [Steinernema hermaphroditum]|uniref:Uncharacterized protein n=1 Tax=Steinernema hermaphroditum TaxID=289476 RepID=A0AA39HK53_9BILA|nr:hypothetical protein QR680_019166 [Steinernema hermaphroditum]
MEHVPLLFYEHLVQLLTNEKDQLSQFPSTLGRVARAFHEKCIDINVYITDQFHLFVNFERDPWTDFDSFMKMPKTIFRFRIATFCARPINNVVEISPEQAKELMNLSLKACDRQIYIFDHEFPFTELQARIANFETFRPLLLLYHKLYFNVCRREQEIFNFTSVFMRSTTAVEIRGKGTHAWPPGCVMSALHFLRSPNARVLWHLEAFEMPPTTSSRIIEAWKGLEKSDVPSGAACNLKIGNPRELFRQHGFRSISRRFIRDSYGWLEPRLQQLEREGADYSRATHYSRGGLGTLQHPKFEEHRLVVCLHPDSKTKCKNRP